MGLSIDEYAQRSRNAAETLADGGTVVRHADPGVRPFGGDAPGRLGELGLRLHAGLVVALAAREREAVAHAARLDDLAQLLRMAGRALRASDAAAARRHPGGGP
jgi:hypothetical protein